MSQNDDNSDELTTKQAALMARVHNRTIITWIQRRWLPAKRRPGLRGRYIISKKELKALLDKEY